MAYRSFKFPSKPLSDSISIMSGNNKLLYVPNTSFPPIITCNRDAPCTISGCYITGGMYWPIQKQAYEKNYNIYLQSNGRYFDFLDFFLRVKSPPMFRFMVSGDIPDFKYLNLIATLASVYKKTNFLCYTKKYQYLSKLHIDSYPSIPPNLNLFASAWPNFHIPSIVKNNFRIAWMQDGTETRIPSNVFNCSKHCTECKFCYSSKLNKDVVFMKH